VAWLLVDRLKIGLDQIKKEEDRLAQTTEIQTTQGKNPLPCLLQQFRNIRPLRSIARGNLNSKKLHITRLQLAMNIYKDTVQHLIINLNNNKKKLFFLFNKNVLRV
jgi:hypothetical protein